MSEQLPSIFADARERDWFASAISEWFRENARELPWRGAIDPWHVLVSEFMLQQTQVERVWPRFIEWIERWPTPADLANSEPAEAAQNVMPCIEVTTEQATALGHGKIISILDRALAPAEAIGAIDPQGSLIAIVQLRDDGTAKVQTGFPQGVATTDGDRP